MRNPRHIDLESPWLADPGINATGERYEIRTVGDFLTVPEARRRICLREFHSWLGIQEDIISLLCATAEASGNVLPRDAFVFHRDVFTWIDDGKGCVSVGEP